MISIKYNFEFGTYGQSIQTIVCISIMFFYITIPLYAYYRSMKEFQNLKSKDLRQKFGAFYKGKAIGKGKHVLIQPVIFLARRLFLVYLVVAGTDELVFQMMMLMGLSLISTLVVYKTEAFELVGERRLSTFSELVILEITYCFFSFDLLDVEANFEVGYFPIVVMGLYIVGFLIIIMVGSIRAIRIGIKLCCAKRY